LPAPEGQTPYNRGLEKGGALDELRAAADQRAAEVVEKIATDRVALNRRHFKFRELALARTAEVLGGLVHQPHRRG
jgi:hypothetical protein